MGCMAEYRISSEIIENFANGYADLEPEEDTHEGLLMHIKSPIQLNPDAVERWFIHYGFEPVTESDRQESRERAIEKPHLRNEIENPVLLGSTDEQTTIYVNVQKYSDNGEAIRDSAMRKLARLLGFMGAQAVIGQPQTPETNKD